MYRILTVNVRTSDHLKIELVAENWYRVDTALAKTFGSGKTKVNCKLESHTSWFHDARNNRSDLFVCGASVLHRSDPYSYS